MDALGPAAAGQLCIQPPLGSTAADMEISQPGITSHAEHAVAGYRNRRGPISINARKCTLEN